MTKLPPLSDEAIAAANFAEASLARATIGAPTRIDGPIVLKDYDPEWPALYAREAARVRGVLGARVVLLEHVGSTSVPGLAAKPIIDIVLEVKDSADEGSYVPAMEAAGYRLRIREPDWFQHRLFKGPDTDVNLHVFSAGCTETVRMIRFRDWLRANDADRTLYEATKQELPARTWTYVQNYADAKGAVVGEILGRALLCGSAASEGKPSIVSR